MAKCHSKTRTGEACKMPAQKGERYCFTHSPATRRAQAEARKKGGESRHTPHFADPATLPAKVDSLAGAHQLLSYTLAEVAGMDNSLLRARVLLALFDSFVKSFEIGGLEERIRALEERGNHGKVTKPS